MIKGTASCRSSFKPAESFNVNRNTDRIAKYRGDPKRQKNTYKFQFYITRNSGIINKPL